MPDLRPGRECECSDLSIGYDVRSAASASASAWFPTRTSVAGVDGHDPLPPVHALRALHRGSPAPTNWRHAARRRPADWHYDGKPPDHRAVRNVIDVCPVGALTNKVFRFKARPWELIAKESLGYHDALGSNLFLHSRRGDVLRSVPRDNEAVNECWLSDRDRYSHQGLYAADRAVKPLVRVASNGDDGDWREASWDEALAKAAQILRDNAADELGILVHPATSNEEGALLARSRRSRHRQPRPPHYAARPIRWRGRGSVRDACGGDRQADVVVIVGSTCALKCRCCTSACERLGSAAPGCMCQSGRFEFTFEVASKTSSHRQTSRMPWVRTNSP